MYGTFSGEKHRTEGWVDSIIVAPKASLQLSTDRGHDHRTRLEGHVRSIAISCAARAYVRHSFLSRPCSPNTSNLHHILPPVVYGFCVCLWTTRARARAHSLCLLSFPLPVPSTHTRGSFVGQPQHQPFWFAHGRVDPLFLLCLMLTS